MGAWRAKVPVVSLSLSPLYTVLPIVHRATRPSCCTFELLYIRVTLRDAARYASIHFADLRPQGGHDSLVLTQEGHASLVLTRLTAGAIDGRIYEGRCVVIWERKTFDPR